MTRKGTRQATASSSAPPPSSSKPQTANMSSAWAATILRKLQVACAERRLSVALGCTVKTTPLASIDAVLSETDALMYENKRRMHQHQA